jgi:hypothetical protein
MIVTRELYKIGTRTNPVQNIYDAHNRIHQSLGVMPVMQAGLSNHLWTLEEIVGLITES